MNIFKIFISFAIIIVIAISSAFFTILKMKELSSQTQKMYSHPFQVSNAVSDIETKIITIHRDMKDVILTTESLEMIRIIESIQKQETEVFKKFDIIYENYLGDKKDIDVSFNSFKNWKVIRQEVVRLMLEGETEHAIAITKGKGAQHIESLYKKIAVLKTYAFKKAQLFYEESIEKDGANEVIAVFLATLLISTIIVAFVIINLIKVNRVNNKQIHLIDQNILFAKLNLNKEIIDISSSLCRVLNLDKADVLGTIHDTFFATSAQFDNFKSQIYSGKEYQGEIQVSSNDSFNSEEWYLLEVIPELDNNYELYYFTLFLTDISNKKMIEKVSITDGLTGLHNRNYFELIFEKELKRAKRDNKELGVLMFDIDFFKQFNDTYGHQEGDKALKAVAHILASATNRSYDYAFRVGGEEFVLLTYRDSVDALEQFSNELLQKIEALSISHKNSEVSDFVTLSCGAIQFGVEHLLSVDDMYKEVDKLLYHAKHEGRNRVVVKTIE